MIINPTKKTQPLFSAIPKVQDARQAKAFSLTNPFFSWHANYFNVNRKKILVLVNDLTLTPVVIYDVNAKNKAMLAEAIVAGIQAAFKLGGISEDEIQRYLALAGEIEVNGGFNRQVTSVTTMFVQMATVVPIDVTQQIQKPLMKWLAEIPVQSLPLHFSELALKEAFSQPLVCLPVNESLLPEPKKKEEIQVEVTWQPFSTWKKYEKEEDWFTGYEDISQQVVENNEQVLEAFSHYLSDGLGLSKKVVQRHRSNAAFYMNGFLVYSSIRTVVTDLSDANAFISDFCPLKILGVSEAEIKRMGASLKKLYEFLAAANVISPKELKELKEEITHGVEFGVFSLELKEDFSDFW